MFTTSTASKLLKLRLDAEHYSPDALNNELTMRKFGAVTLSEVIDVGESGYGTLPASLDYCDEDNGVPLVRGGDLYRGHINNPRVWVPEAYRTAKSRLQTGDVLFLIKGACIDGPDGVGLVSPNLEDAIFNGSCFRARCAAIDPGFLVAFSLTSKFLIQKKREIANTGISYNSQESILGYIIPLTGEEVQKHIGDMVRLSQQQRTLARIGIQLANKALLSHVPTNLPDNFHESPRRIGYQFVSENSLSPEYGRALLGHKLFNNAIPLSACVSECKCGEAIRMDERNDGRYPYYGASGPIDFHDEFNFDGEYLVVAQDGTIGCASVARGKFWANNHVWILRVRPEYDADAIAAFLNQCYPFWKGMTTGSVVPKVTSENLLCVAIPEGIATAKSSIGVRLRSVAQQLALADTLIQASKYLVEGLIDGKLSGTDLSTAYMQRKQGDLSCDRAVLSRLYEGGIDATDTRPLLPDLDAYYETLLLAEQDLADGGDE